MAALRVQRDGHKNIIAQIQGRESSLAGRKNDADELDEYREMGDKEDLSTMASDLKQYRELGSIEDIKRQLSEFQRLRRVL